MELRGIEFLTVCLAVCISVGYARAPAKIINGQNAAEREFPYQVEVRRFNLHWCGGSIIDATHILTAAHCVVSKSNKVSRLESIQVVAGIIDTGARRNDSVFAVSKITYHQDYDPTKSRRTAYFADIAVLELAKPIPFNSYQMPISLPSNKTSAGTPVVASGWGLTYYDGKHKQSLRWLQKLEMKTIPLGECAAALSDQVADGQICAIGGQGSSTCLGDSGGPLAYKNELIGIVSWGSSCGKGYPDVFTNVFYYIPWIKRAML